METIVRLYQGQLIRGYVRGKLRDDPVFPAAFDLLQHTPLPVLDLGCGMGLLQFYLRECGYDAPLFGVDFDERKIRQADRVGRQAYRDLTFTTGDAGSAENFSGHIVMLDMLHYLDATRQAALLAQVAAQIAPGGYCLIRDTLRDGSWRFRATAFGELFITAVSWQKTRAVHYPTVEATCAPFRERGFSCEVRPLWGRTPFNSYLFTFRAPEQSQPHTGGIRNTDTAASISKPSAHVCPKLARPA